MKAIPNSVRNKRVSNARQRKQQHLLDVKIRESKERSRRFRAVSGWICKTVLFVCLIGGAWFGGKEGLRHFVWENPDYFLREINVMTDGALTREQVLTAAGLSEGRNIFTVDLAKARSAVESLPQVESASVQRMLPNRMTVTVSERRPIAWIAAKGDEDPSTSERSFLVDARGIVLRSRVVLPEYHHLPIISGFETENLVLGKRVPAWEMQSALELVRLNADNPQCQLRHIDLAKGYCLVALDQQRREIVFGLENIDEQLQRLNRCLDRAGQDGRQIRTINVIPRINVPVTFIDPQSETMPVSNTAEPAVRKPEPPPREKAVETVRKAEPIAVKASPAPASSSRQPRPGLPVKKPFFPTRKKMGRDQIVVGLEIGTSKVCAVVGETRGDGTIRILGVGQAPSRGVRKGEIVDFETAGKCIREALVDAEEKSDVMIGSVYLGVTGSHINGFNNRGAVNIPEDRDEIFDDDFEDVQASAREVSIPAPNMFVHSILQHYYVDGQDGVLNPIGMCGRKLEADFHIIHGVATRIKNSVRCVKEVGPEVLDVVFNPLAAAQVVLDQNQKSLGALVVDMGGGTTDYIVYVDGAVKQSGALGIGGDHITNDISLGLRIPMAKAERLKVEEGSVILGNSRPGEAIVLKDETGFAGKSVEREMLNTIIHCRVRESFELLKKRLDEESYLQFLSGGLMLTGGCSLLKGVNHLAEEVFGLPVHVTHAQTVSGLTSAFENPQFSTAIGLIKYAEAMQPARPTGLFDRIRRRIPFLGA